MSRGAGAGKETFRKFLGAEIESFLTGTCCDGRFNPGAIELKGSTCFHKPAPTWPFSVLCTLRPAPFGVPSSGFVTRSVDKAALSFVVGDVEPNISLRPTLVAAPFSTITGLAITACCALPTCESSSPSLDSSSKKESGRTASSCGDFSSGSVAFSSRPVFCSFLALSMGLT